MYGAPIGIAKRGFAGVGLSNRRHYWLAVAMTVAGMSAVPGAAQIARPGTAPARGPDTPKPDTSTATPTVGPDTPIVPESAFDAALPPLSSDLNAPLETMAPLQPLQPVSTEAVPAASAPASGLQVGQAAPAIAPEDPELVRPLAPIATFDTAPLETAADIKDRDAPEIKYETVVNGLDALELTDAFKGLSALREGKGEAANATQVSARAREDEALAVRLMKSIGYYDGSAISTIEQIPGTPGKLRAIVSATPGRLYSLSSVTITAPPTVPADLIRSSLPLKAGDPIAAARIQGAEANVALTLPRQGYPFGKVGERDILLDDVTPTGAYTLPVDTGPRSSFGQITTAGDAVFDPDHLNVFPRFKTGELYDNRRTDDLRDALVATSLFSTVTVVPQRTGRPGPDGTEQVDLLVTQSKGKYRSLSGLGGYSTGQGFTLEGTFTHRNLFPPEGALIASVIAGTQQQGLSATFRRSNAGKRDRTVSLIASALRQDYDAYDALTATVAGKISYDSTPIWQKKFTYAYGFELVGTNESVFDFALGDRRRGTYFIAALPGQAMFDRSDSLLNPTKGYRLKINVSPETSVRGAARPYVRGMVEATGYYPVGQSLVIAGRARVGTIAGIERDDLAPSRRYYGGGGGSVRGYGYQRLGPLDPQGNPVGGRSLNEFALEARYRFGDFGIVPFIDAGQAYDSSTPKGSDLQYGAGIGGRFYTNFGPMRVDVATPLNPRPGDGKVALYISIGQAF